MCSGLLPSLIGVCHVAIQFPLYEYAKVKLAERSKTTPEHLDPLALVNPHSYVMTRGHPLCQPASAHAAISRPLYSGTGLAHERRPVCYQLR